ncbi:hypothetical protein N2W54_006346 [Lotmaria passim]
MKARRHHAALGEVVDPSPFDYTLLSHLYVHSDGTDVIDFGGFAPGKESRVRINSFLKNRSFAPDAFHAVTPETRGSYLHLRVNDYERDDDSTCPNDASTHTPFPPSSTPSSLRNVASAAYAHAQTDASNLVRIEDSTEHWWLMSQRDESSAPFARQFRHAEDLARYLESHNTHLPTGELSDNADDEAENGGKGSREKEHAAAATERARQSRGGALPAAAVAEEKSASVVGPSLPLAKWLDVQIDCSQPNSAERVAGLLDLLPISQETKDSCLYLSMVDSVDVSSAATGEASDATSGYVFLNLMCTPVVDMQEETSASGAGDSVKKRGFLSQLGGDGHTAGKSGQEKKKNKVGSKKRPARVSARGAYATTRSVMEMHFEAVRVGAPRSSVPEAVPVGVIVFADWMFTIHSKPFAEMDDLLRMVQLHCAPPELMSARPCSSVLLAPSMRRRFTTPFVLSMFLQIAVGHHLDSTTLAQVVDELGDDVFAVKEKQQDQDEVVKRITAVRRCFGECGADTARREVLFATLLQPIFAEQFFVADLTTRRELENAQAHLWQFQREISDCRDTVAVSNWYHNVAIQWVLLRRGNRALRMVLLLTEMANIMYPIVTLQTLYAMNVRLPFEANGDPPNNSLVPFFVLAGVFLAYSTLTLRAVRSLMKRKSFQTQLLA